MTFGGQTCFLDENSAKSRDGTQQRSENSCQQSMAIKFASIWCLGEKLFSFKTFTLFVVLVNIVDFEINKRKNKKIKTLHLVY